MAQASQVSQGGTQPKGRARQKQESGGCQIMSALYRARKKIIRTINKNNNNNNTTKKITLYIYSKASIRQQYCCQQEETGDWSSGYATRKTDRFREGSTYNKDGIIAYLPSRAWSMLVHTHTHTHTRAAVVRVLSDKVKGKATPVFLSHNVLHSTLHYMHTRTHKKGDSASEFVAPVLFCIHIIYTTCRGTTAVSFTK